MKTQTKLAAVAALLLSSTLFSMDAVDDGVPGGRAAVQQQAPAPKKLTFAEQMAAKKAAAAQKLAGDADALRLREEAARQDVLRGVAGKKTLEEFAAEAVDGKVGAHFVVPHAGHALINTATHKAILATHESFDPTAGTHVTVADAQRLIDAETQAKELAEANYAASQSLLDVVKADFGGDVAGAMDGVLTPLCAALKVGTDVEATADADLVAALVAADAGADTLVAKFLAAHGAIAKDSPDAKRVQTLVDLIKFFNA